MELSRGTDGRRIARQSSTESRGRVGSRPAPRRTRGTGCRAAGSVIWARACPPRRDALRCSTRLGAVDRRGMDIVDNRPSHDLEKPAAPYFQNHFQNARDERIPSLISHSGCIHSCHIRQQDAAFGHRVTEPHRSACDRGLTTIGRAALAQARPTRKSLAVTCEIEGSSPLRRPMAHRALREQC